MKKNKMMRIASVLLVAVLLSTCVISGTFAKYTSTFEGEDTAKVAKWDVSTVDKDSQTFTFNLFNTINDTQNDAAETDVTTDKIAPGTKGSFTITLASKSEVTANYAVSYVVTNTKNVPIKFSVDNGANWTEINTITGDSGTITVDQDFSKDITVMWEWEFREGEVDNAYSEAEITVEATVTFEQVD